MPEHVAEIFESQEYKTEMQRFYIWLEKVIKENSLELQEVTQ
jgi:hypothetical protein